MPDTACVGMDTGLYDIISIILRIYISYIYIILYNCDVILYIYTQCIYIYINVYIYIYIHMYVYSMTQTSGSCLPFYFGLIVPAVSTLFVGAVTSKTAC